MTIFPAQKSRIQPGQILNGKFCGGEAVARAKSFRYFALMSRLRLFYKNSLINKDVLFILKWL
jgi:hypothetical protein